MIIAISSFLDEIDPVDRFVRHNYAAGILYCVSIIIDSVDLMHVLALP